MPSMVWARRAAGGPIAWTTAAASSRSVRARARLPLAAEARAKAMAAMAAGGELEPPFDKAARRASSPVARLGFSAPSFR